MKKLTIPRSRFNLKKFVKAVHSFALTMGGDESFPIVQDGVAVYDRDLCDMMNEDESEVPDDPVERLECGHTLFCQFALCRDFDLLVCADGTEIDLPSVDEDEDEETEGDEEERADEDETYCDENRSYGLLIALERDKVVIESGVMCDLSGDPEVEVVEDAGLVNEPMRRWVNSFLFPKRGGKA